MPKYVIRWESLTEKGVNRITGTLSRLNDVHSYQTRKVTTHNKVPHRHDTKQIDGDSRRPKGQTPIMFICIILVNPRPKTHVYTKVKELYLRVLGLMV